MTDIDDKLLEQQEQEQREREMDPQFEAGGNGHDKEEEDLSETEQNREEILENERRQAEQRQQKNKQDKNQAKISEKMEAGKEKEKKDAYVQKFEFDGEIYEAVLVDQKPSFLHANNMEEQGKITISATFDLEKQNKILNLMNKTVILADRTDL
jgi:hypothetical protein